MLHPLPSLGIVHARKQINSSDAIIHIQHLPQKLFLVKFTAHLHATRLTPHGASRLIQAMSAWSAKTRRAPSRHCKDTRVYGHRLRPCMT